MINFLHPILNPKVICDKSALGGYEAKNLISKSYIEKANGFLAYTTFKPPIDLDFELICPVDIHYIIIKSTVGNHRSTGLEILAKCSESFVSIGKSFHDEDGVVFLSNGRYTKDKLPPSLPQNYHICFLRRVGNVSHNTKNIKIRIIRSGKFVPCLGSIEVWGQVARSCAEVTKNTVETLYNRHNTDSSSLLLPLIENEANEKCKDTASGNHDGIPEDFKDNLTYELMSVPMTLPSGKTIDQSTLDKHISSEKQFGRKPGDPFTGLKFTATSKPILNVALKCRIDMFLLKNSSVPEYFNKPRTVGRKQSASSDNCCDNYVKKIKLDDGDEITIDTFKLKLKQFKEVKTKCCVECESSEVLFVLPCKHIYCRKCLNGICVYLKCKCCSKSFSRSNVERLHL
ncbi:RING finger protein 37 [Coccinella septempunctata]|uniref:RING finger protein 37 n=1 Tax=Coccinella septempunctata TaxID=41139 RepID=UPI001D08D9D5|nr:RING finger protein 37 [Coccinella septempunctata]